MEVKAQTHIGDCLDILQKMEPESADLVYVDPPFFTQKVHDLVTRDGSSRYRFRDVWDSDRSYADFIYQRIARARDVLKSSGSLFFHCDKSASHIVRLMLDSIFSPDNFQSEIIWHFKRWSNAKKVGYYPPIKQYFSIRRLTNSNSILFIKNIRRRPTSTRSCKNVLEIIETNRFTLAMGVAM